jgi:hypothetical protein
MPLQYGMDMWPRCFVACREVAVAVVVGFCSCTVASAGVGVLGVGPGVGAGVRCRYFPLWYVASV